MICPYCGGEMKETDKFCPHCGAGAVKRQAETAEEPSYGSYRQEPVKESDRPGYSKALASMILGICSIALMIVLTPFAGIVLGVIGLVLNSMARGDGYTGSYLKAGKICSIVGIVLSAILLVLAAVLIGSFITIFSDIPRSYY